MPRLRTVSLKGYPLTVSVVKLRMAEQRTVLVGPNGVGKSAVFETIEALAGAAVGRPGSGLASGMATFEIEIGDSQLVYTCSREFRENLDPEVDEEISDYWSESCVLLHPDNWVEEVWRVDEGQVEGIDATDVVVPHSVGLMTVDPSVAPSIAPHVLAVRRALASIRRTSAGVPRSAARRRAIWLEKRRRRSRFYPFLGASTRLESMLWTLVRWKERNDDRATAFEQLMRTLRLPSNLELHNTFVPTDEESAGTKPTHVRVLLDGEDVGYLSDGTLRSMEIVVALLNLREGATLLIEEPETAIHPGLLQRLLTVIESYSAGANVVISTHSPLVVDWAKPDELRFVRRSRRSTTIASMSKQQQAYAREYLLDEGTLGELVFQEDGEDYYANGEEDYAASDEEVIEDKERTSETEE